MSTTERKPTDNDVRKHYEDRGYEVRISRDGHVTFRNRDVHDSPRWLEGRWVSEYRVDRDGTVILT